MPIFSPPGNYSRPILLKRKKCAVFTEIYIVGVLSFVEEKGNAAIQRNGPFWPNVLTEVITYGIDKIFQINSQKKCFKPMPGGGVLTYSAERGCAAFLQEILNMRSVFSKKSFNMHNFFDRAQMAKTPKIAKWAYFKKNP